MTNIIIDTGSDTLEEQIEAVEAKLAELKASAEAQKDCYPEMVDIPDRDYSVGKFTITVGEWNTYARAQELEEKEGDPRHPVTNVSWYEATAYCEWLSKHTGEEYALPVEDQFEHFCGDHTEANPEIAVYDQDQVALVGTKNPNKFGLHDCLGNVWEWQNSVF